MKMLYRVLISLSLNTLIFAVGCSVLPEEEPEEVEDCPEELDRESCDELPNCASHPLGGVDPETCEGTGSGLNFCIHYDFSGGNDAPAFWARWEDGEWKFYRADDYGFMRTKEEFINCLTTVEHWPHGERPDACDTCHPEFRE